jgi:hypothetical protein
MRLFTFSTAMALSILAAGIVSAQVNEDEKQEFAVTVGELSGSTPSVPGGSVTLGSGVGLEANFARKIRDHQWGSVYWEADALGGPLRYVTTTAGSHAVRSAFVAPGLKLQFLPRERWSPWIAGGAGYAFYDTKVSSTLFGVTSVGSVTTNTYALDFGAGVDCVVRPRFVIRGDVRGFYTGGPNLGFASTSGQLNVVIGGGIVWRFAK